MNPCYSPFLGALVGDAIGSYLEFHRQVTEEQVEQALRLPGGGPHHTGRGQITDDGELSLALWTALQDMNPSGKYDVLKAIRAYGAWYDSMPFDIGQTCSFAFEACSEFCEQKQDQPPNQNEIKGVLLTIHDLNKTSEANGALMRMAPLITYASIHGMFPEHAADWAKQDARLSHPSLVCQECNAIYVYTGVGLRRGHSPEYVLHHTLQYVTNHVTSKSIHQWIFEESLDLSSIVYGHTQGHVRWPMIYCFYWLRHPEITYQEMMRIILRKGGDTDTICAIVGGLIACAQPIPLEFLRPVLRFDCTQHEHIRPKEYSVRHVLAPILPRDIIDSAHV